MQKRQNLSKDVGCQIIISMSTHRRKISQHDDTRTQLKEMLTTLKQHHTQRPLRLPCSLDINHHLKNYKPSPLKKNSLPHINKDSKSPKRPCDLNTYQKHIIGNYLNAHLKIQKQQMAPIKPIKPKRLKNKQMKYRVSHKRKNRYVREGEGNQGDTIEQADIETVLYKSKYRSNKVSKYQSIEQKEEQKQYSLKDSPMKHYVQEKLARKQRQWKELPPLERQTYFSMIREKGIIGPGNSQIKNNNNSPQKNNLKVPKQEELSKFIKNYQSRTKDIDIPQLVKRSTFNVDLSELHLYFGETHGGKKEGSGVEVRQGYLFEGKWMNGCRIKGYEITQNGTYIGSFRQDKKDGKGEFFWINGQFYSGEWMGGKRHGVGLWSSPQGDSYMGEWKRGGVQGQGVHKMGNGQRYEGSFKNFLKHGWGRQKFPNGDRYEGNYFEGMPHGSGNYIWKDGLIFQGNFIRGLRQGDSVMHNDQGFHFKGTFVKQSAEGSCEIVYGNGETYQGEIKRGKRQGKGTLRHAAKRQLFSGFWKQNQFVAEEQAS